ncbi:MAG: hypothetical protein WD271_03325 [Acidimicrobiia bacterium]
MRKTHRVAVLTAALAACLATVGLGAAIAPGAGAAGSNTLTVKAGEYTYKVSGSPKAGWTEVEFDNPGLEFHMLGMVQLKKGVTVKQLKAALLSDDENAGNKLVAGDGDVSPLPSFLSAGERTTILTKLPSGHYGMFCFVPAPDGESHVAHGMVKVFDVGSGKSSLSPPKDGVVNVTISDSGITLPSSGLPKSGWVKVTNGTSVPRSLTLARYLTPTATFEDGDAYFNEFFESGQVPTGDPPAAIAGGIEGIAPGSTGYFELAMKSGRYVLVSSNAEEENDPNELHTDFTVK